MAPAMPFYAEYLWQAVKVDEDEESVHLEKWPEAGEVNETVLDEMRQTREVVTAALEARTKAGIKVRQPIASVTGQEIGVDMQQIVLDELNAKSYHGGAEVVSIDTSLTPKLLAEGAVRELMRAVQGARKQAGLEPQNNIELTVETNEAGQAAVLQHQDLLLKTVGAVDLKFTATAGEPLEVGDFSFVFVITKV
jgi:isoleucyl-tRNA synthetase